MAILKISEAVLYSGKMENKSTMLRTLLPSQCMIVFQNSKISSKVCSLSLKSTNALQEKKFSFIIFSQKMAFFTIIFNPLNSPHFFSIFFYMQSMQNNFVRLHKLFKPRGKIDKNLLLTSSSKI